MISESVVVAAAAPLGDSVRAAERHNCYESVAVDATAPLGDSVRAAKRQKLTPRLMELAMKLVDTEKIAGWADCRGTPQLTGTEKIAG